jgi:hypothetical protein
MRGGAVLFHLIQYKYLFSLLTFLFIRPKSRVCYVLFREHKRLVFIKTGLSKNTTRWVEIFIKPVG